MRATRCRRLPSEPRHVFARLKSRELWQFGAAATLLAELAVLATVGFWPFDARTLDHGDTASVADLAPGDRLTIGRIRTAVPSVATYLVVSVPSFVIDRRWMQGVTKTGLTADADRRALRLEELGAEIAQTPNFLGFHRNAGRG